MIRNSSEPRESLAPGVREDQAAGGGRSVVTVPQPSDIGQQGLPLEDFRARRAFERDRRELALGIVRTHLGEQPSNRSVRNCARRWADAVIRLADDVIAERQKQEHE